MARGAAQVDFKPGEAGVEAGKAPLLPEVGVVALVPESWGAPWLSRQQVLTRLAKYFRVVWVDPARDWRELWLADGVTSPGTEAERLVRFAGFSVYTPGRWLPRLYRPRPLAAYLAKKRVRNAVRILLRDGCKKVVLYIWRPSFGFALDATPYDFSCYHIVDEYTFAEEEQPLPPAEAALIARADQVIVHSPALMEKKGHLNPHTVLVPNGVEYETFARATSEPPDMRGIPRPRFGYVGIVKKQLDLGVLDELARDQSDCSFVLVGPLGTLGDQAPKLEELVRLENVFYLGGKPRTELSAYMQHMDVCMLPYKIDGYTKFIYPLKLHEYLAAGRPVVASPIRSLMDFSNVLRFARTSDEWSAGLRECLSEEERTPARVEARRRIARDHDWDSLVYRIAVVFCERLGLGFLERLSSTTGKSPGAGDDNRAAF